MNLAKHLFVFTLLLFPFFAFSQNVLRVPGDFPTIQQALDAAEGGDQVLVAPGTYFESIEWPTQDSITLISETGRDNTFIDGGGQNRIFSIVGETDDILDQSITQATVIDGFTIRNGYVEESEGAGLFLSEASPALRNLNVISNTLMGLDNIPTHSPMQGAGMKALKYNGLIENCNFNDNHIINGERPCAGAGAFIENVMGEIRNCQFNNNSIETTNSCLGAGLVLTPTDDVTVRDCHIIGNTSASTSCFGGGLYVENYGSLSPMPFVKLRDCKIADNLIVAESSGNGGGIFFGLMMNLESTSCLIENNVIDAKDFSLGAGIYLDIVSFNVLDSTDIINNRAIQAEISDGGGIYVGDEFLEIKNCRILNNQATRGAGIHFADFGHAGTCDITNSYISRNHARPNTVAEGSAFFFGAMSMDLNLINSEVSYNEGTPVSYDEFTNFFSNVNIYHSTMAHNGGPLNMLEGVINIINSIIWSDGNEQIIVEDPLSVSEINVNHSLIKGGYVGENNIDADPEFINPITLIPSKRSLCLNSGSSDLGITEDLLGNPRPVPAGSNPDIGAYEIEQSLAHVQVYFYYDEDQNGQRNGSERNLEVGTVIDDEGFEYYNFGTEGIYVGAELGPLTLFFDDKNNEEWMATSETVFEFNVDSDDFSESVEIGLFPERFFNFPYTYLEGDRFRCGEEVEFTLNVVNDGTAIESGMVSMVLDDRIEEVRFPIPPSDQIGDFEYIWDYENLYPGEVLSIPFFVTAPLIENASEVGEIYSFKSNLETQFFKSLSRCLDLELRCAFDPNDKLVDPSRPDSLALFEEALIYKIRFQNTGNDYARNVFVLDTLDQALDLSTFKIINTSHPKELEVTFIDEYVLKFDFQNIYLPDSTTNWEGSNGHVSYSIRTREGLPVSTAVENTGHIFFDFNPAIVTNTTHNIMVDTFPLKTSIDLIEIQDVLVFPNPMKEQFTIQGDLSSYRISILNKLGQTLRVITPNRNETLVDVEELDAGLYFLQLENKKDHRITTQKIIKQ